MCTRIAQFSDIVNIILLFNIVKYKNCRIFELEKNEY